MNAFLAIPGMYRCARRGTMIAGALLGTFAIPLASFQQDASQAWRTLARLRSDIRWETRNVVTGDFDGDGRRDQAFLGHGKKQVFVGIVYSSSRKPEISEFGVGQMQAGICSEPAKLEIEQLDYDPSDAVGKLEGFERSRTVKGLRLSGGECDDVHLFWNHVTKHLDWWRL